MTGAAPLPESDEAPPGGRLVENIIHFGRTLRAAGLPVGPGRIIDAVNAVRATGITDRTVFYWTLHATFVSRRSQREIFDQAFHIFWRNPKLLERMMGLVLPGLRAGGAEETEALSRRVADALNRGQSEAGAADEDESTAEAAVEFDAAMTYAPTEQLQGMDFDEMSAAEIAEAERAVAAMTLTLPEQPRRRHAPHPTGPRIDFRATLRAAQRSGGEIITLRHARPTRRVPPIVVLCDISGSMGRYSRMLLHFTHRLTGARLTGAGQKVHTFLFGTRLTNVTRALRYRDVDEALRLAGNAVEDWSGGTRIGDCLHQFNRDWSRRVLGQGALVLLISDGLDRDAGVGLAAEVARIQRSCRRLIWLNPLLRFDGFAPKSSGIRAILPHVDAFRPVHSLNSLADLAASLTDPGLFRAGEMAPWHAQLRPEANRPDTNRPDTNQGAAA